MPVTKTMIPIRPNPSSKFWAIFIVKQTEQWSPIQSWSRWAKTKFSAKTAARVKHRVKMITGSLFCHNFTMPHTISKKPFMQDTVFSRTRIAFALPCFCKQSVHFIGSLGIQKSSAEIPVFKFGAEK